MFKWENYLNASLNLKTEESDFRETVRVLRVLCELLFVCKFEDSCCKIDSFVMLFFYFVGKGVVGNG